MAWIESHQSLATHLKTFAAAEALGVNKYLLIGHLHQLWWWGLDNALNEDGFLGDISDSQLAAAAGWQRKDSAFVDALINAKFVDERDDGRYLHDWFEYAGKLMAQRARNKQRMTERRAKNNPDTTPTRAPNDPNTTPTRAPNDPNTTPTRAPNDPNTTPTRAPNDPNTTPTRAPATVPNRTQPYQVTSPPLRSETAPGAPSEETRETLETGGIPQETAGAEDDTVESGLPSLQFYEPETLEGWLQILDEELRRPGRNPVALVAEAARRFSGEAVPNFGRVGGICTLARKEYDYVLKVMWDAKGAAPTGDFLDYVTGIIKADTEAMDAPSAGAKELAERALRYGERQEAEDREVVELEAVEAEAQDG